MTGAADRRSNGTTFVQPQDPAANKQSAKLILKNITLKFNSVRNSRYDPKKRSTHRLRLRRIVRVLPEIDKVGIHPVIYIVDGELQLLRKPLPGSQFFCCCHIQSVIV